MESYIEVLKNQVEILLRGITEIINRAEIVYDRIEGIINFEGDYEIRMEKGMQRNQMQSRLYKDYKLILQKFDYILSEEPGDRIRKLQDAGKFTENLLSRSSITTHYKTQPEVIDNLVKSWEKIVHMIEASYARDLSEEIVIPDTSFLYDFPELKDWRSLREGGKLCIVVPTIVLQELDQAKEYHKNKDIWQKAKQLVWRLREYTKSNQMENIYTVNEFVSLILESTEPRKNRPLLESLDFSVPDDRFIASALEITSRYRKSICYVATLDINLTNKAKSFGLPVSDNVGK